jgi:hypothetical protein
VDSFLPRIGRITPRSPGPTAPGCGHPSSDYLGRIHGTNPSVDAFLEIGRDRRSESHRDLEYLLQPGKFQAEGYRALQ